MNFKNINDQDLCQTLQLLLTECDFSDNVSHNFQLFTQYVTQATAEHLI